MVQHVWERARRARTVDRVLVATDDERIAEAVRAFGGEVAMTARTHATGTDRLAEAARATEAEIVVNVQGDEPMLDWTFIDGAVGPLRADPDLPMSTVSLPLTDVEEMVGVNPVLNPVPVGKGKESGQRLELLKQQCPIGEYFLSDPDFTMISVCAAH